LQKFDIKEWVHQNPDYTAFRQAVHTILTAIAGTPFLQTSMIMKGGVLLALSYNSPRFTKDIDFSTATRRPEFDLDEFRRHLDDSLINTVEALDYGLDCRIQSCVLSPKSEDATWPTIQVSIGYAYKGSPAHKRLQSGIASQVVRIDYSLNEPVEETELFELEEGSIIHTYSFVEMVAEKFRALLQQEARNRVRRQDIYDLHYVLSDHPLRDDPATRARILERLVEKSRIRDLPVDPEAMSNPEIRRRSEAEYNNLAPEIEGELPRFAEVYDLVETFYRSLPWATRGCV
jgi:predicted nucleotidyltransferase component of viral defense system